MPIYSGGGGGGGGAGIRPVGPFTKGHAAFTGVGGNFPTLLTNLAAGELVVGCWAVPTVAFDGTAPTLAIVVAPQADLTNSTSLNEWSGLVDTTDPSFLSSLASAGTSATKMAVDVGAAALAAFYSNSGGVTAPTVGSAAFYALVYTP